METISIILDGLTFVVIIVSGFLLKNYLPSYFGEKGKNLATKEDIVEITDKIEGVKNQYVIESEKVRAKLDRESQVHRVQFEKEFEILYNLWGKLVALKNATLQLRPILDTIDPNKNEDERKIERLGVFKDAYFSFAKFVEENQPFFQKAIYPLIINIINIARTEADNYLYTSPYPGVRRYKEDYWEKAYKASGEIIKSINKVEEAIRKRIIA